MFLMGGLLDIFVILRNEAGVQCSLRGRTFSSRRRRTIADLFDFYKGLGSNSKGLRATLRGVSAVVDDGEDESAIIGPMVRPSALRSVSEH
jgi:hypothetical protein